MKVILRILVILIAIGIAIAALLPPDRAEHPSSKPDKAEASPAATPEKPAQPNLIRDMLGGAALDSGKKAKDKIREVNQLRRDQFEGLE